MWRVADLNTRVVYVLSTAMLGVMIYELAYNGKEQGNPFSFKLRAFNRRLFGSGAVIDRPCYIACRKSDVGTFIQCPD